jgi:two-component system, NtrC family, response regulator HydG
MRARLTVESGLASPRVSELEPTTRLRLGRHRDNEVLLQDKHASRFHAELLCRGGRWYVIDRSTTNGTRLDGTLVEGEAALSHNQVVSVGEIRLRFAVITGSEEPTAESRALEAPPPSEEAEDTKFELDEMTALFRFMNGTLGESTPDRLVRTALEAILSQTGAELAGFLSLDDSPDLRLVLPVQASVDRHLSRRLTQQVQQQGRLVWLGSPQDRALESESLSSFSDAVCVPLRASLPGGAAEAPLGALHVYKTTRPFSQRQVRFCEVIGGSLAASLHLLRARRALEADNSRLRVHSPSGDDELVGASQAMGRLRDQVRRLADGPVTVLIFGESGVGKELVALGLHRRSHRAKGPLVTVNCAAITGTMAESELFGHVKGAFTGATRDHPGFFAQADMGTLFLDELSELSLDLQAKLLRVLETRCFRPVGARADQRADVRILAATNRDLERESREGRFRRDLFYRLTTRVVVPPLREHPDDVPELARHFLARLNVEYRRDVQLSEPAVERLMSYTWPGNVRQLRSVLEAAVAMAGDGTVLHAGDLYLPDDRAAGTADRPPSLNLEALEEWAIRHALAETDGNNTQAARLLGIHRDTLINKLKKYRIEKEA